MTTTRGDDQLEVNVAAALHVVETGDAESVTVVTETRPNYSQLIRARSMCDKRGHLFTVIGVDGFRIRRGAAIRSDEPTLRPAAERSVMPPVIEHLLGMSEGVR